MSDCLEHTAALVYPGRIKVPYNWWVGETGSRFLVALRDEKKLLGTWCPQCQRVDVPPRLVCGRCFTADLEWRELGSQGTLVTFAQPRTPDELHPRALPWAYAVIKLDGADSGLTHLVAEFQPGQLRIGLRVEAVFREQRQGHILDIEYFRPIS